MTTIEDLRPLVDDPMERPDAEYKNWLNLQNEHGKAVLAKAAIALANHGGGYIILGMPEGENKIPQSVPCPEAIRPTTQDGVNSVVARYAEPSFHCGLRMVPHRTTQVQHPIILVPSTLTVPVMSRRDCEGVIQQNRCYIRKQGPRSEEATTAEDWRTLLNRCVRANQDEMLDAIRAIVAGGVEVRNPIPDALDELRDYCADSRHRWGALVSNLPADSPSAFPHGYWEVGFCLIGANSAASLIELQSRMNVARQINFNGWPLFLSLDRADLAPGPIDNCIEAWVGRPVPNRWFNEPAHCDFWRASPYGKFYSIRGYLEDGIPSFGSPGSSFDISFTVRRIGEGLLFANRLAETFEDVEQIAVHCNFTGLRGRQLTMFRSYGSPIPMGRTCRTNDFTLETQVALQQVRDNLAEVIHPLLSPLFEQFDLYELKSATVQNALEELQKRRF